MVARTVGPLLGKAFTAMTGPIGIAVMAIAALAAAIFYFYDDVKVPLMNVINFFIELYNEHEGLRVAVAVLRGTFIYSFRIMQGAIEGLIGSFKVLFNAIKTALTEGFSAGLEALTTGMKAVNEQMNLNGEEAAAEFAKGVADARTREPLALVTEEDMDGAMDRFMALFDWFDNTAANNPVEVEVTPAPATAPAAAAGMLGAIEEFEEEEEDFEDDFDFDPSAFLAKLEKMRAAATQAMLDIEAAVKNAAGSLLYDMGNAIGKIIAEGAASVNLMGVALQNLANLLQEIGKALIQQAVAMIAFKKLLFKNPVAAAAAGVAFVAAGAILSAKASQLEMPALAKGGLAFGPTQAIVGDNSGARIDPEVIAPLSKLKDMMGGNQVEVFGRISGDDIYLSNARTGTKRHRYA
jgi:tetratricopeptide (TPR) repeat protein